MLTIKEMKTAAENIAAKYNIEYRNAQNIIVYLRDVDGGRRVLDIAAGNFSSVEAAAAACGVSLGYTPPIKPVDGSKKKKTVKHTVKKEKPVKKETAAAVVRVDGEILPADTPAGELPENLPAKINDCLEDFCTAQKIDDLRKERQTVWGAACMYIGANLIKPSAILRDREKEKTRGGILYDAGRVAALIDLWLYYCQLYGKAPMVYDFSYFSGVSYRWFYDDSCKNLTPERVQTMQKLRDIQEKGLSSMIVDGRQNPTGALACLNHWHGWTQSREIIHTSATNTQSTALPMFDD